MKTEEEIKKDIEKKIKLLIKTGKTKEVAAFRKFHKEEDLRDSFFNKLLFWSYEKNRKKRDQLLKEAKTIATKIPDLKGWPKNPLKFWDTESYSWEKRIPKKIRLFIKKELSKLKGKNLCLGSGSYPYVEKSVLLDFSKEMLNQAPKGYKKVLHNLEEKTLPFKNNSFDSVTMVFIVDYIKNLKNLIKEVKRVLKKDGKLIIVNSKKPIDDFYRIQEKKHLTKSDFKKLLSSFDFKIKEKQIGNKTLLFIEAKV